VTWYSCIASSSAACVFGALLGEHLGAGDVGRHQVGGELDALERQVENARDRLDEQRLGQPGHAGDQAVAAREERHQHFVDHGVLSDDHLAQLGEDALAAVGHALGDGGDVGRRGVGGGGHAGEGVHQCVSE
jgi:hypothetical protein